MAAGAHHASGSSCGLRSRMAAQPRAANRLALGPGSRRHGETKASEPCEQVHSTKLTPQAPAQAQD